MARPRKTAVKKQDALLTPQEVGEIPVEEQPYPLPKGWKWVYASDIFDILYGKGLPTKNLTETGYPVFGANGKIGYYSKYMYSEPKALMSCRGAYSGTMNLSLPFSYVTNNSLIIEGKYHKFAPKFIFLLFSSLDKKSLITGSAQPQVTIQSFNHYPVPLPPENLHGRIVDNIESLFAKLDEAKEQAEAVVDGFETRKAAILHKAFTGELTREIESFSTWREKTAEELFTYVTSGSRGWAKYYAEEGAVFLRMGNLDHGTIELDLSDIQHVKLPRKAEGQRSRLQKNDILISITADVGMVGLVRDEQFEGYINQHIALARPAPNEDAEFLAWYLVSDVGLSQMKQKQRGATKVGLGLDDIRTMRLKMPTVKTQRIVVRILVSLLAKEQQTKEAAENVLEQIELIKKSILARAFRGELGIQ